jgi:magnesium-transporting ATPase (P-type)
LQANAAWYITLIMCQFWHIWTCKTRRVSIFKHRGVLENKVTWYGVVAALAIMIVCVYVPFLQVRWLKCYASRLHVNGSDSCCVRTQHTHVI